MCDVLCVLQSAGIERDAAEKLRVYADLLKEENKKHNLTRIVDDVQIATLHFLDALAPVRLGLIAQKASLVDIGTGGGLPCVPLAIVRPDLQITAVEAVGKKLAFVERVAKELALHIACIKARAEELAHTPLRGTFDFAVSRAVAALPMLMELCAPFVKVGGVFLAYKGSAARQEVAQAARAQSRLGLGPARILDAQIPEVEHVVLSYSKERPTPDVYPRRFSKIKTQPL